MPASAEKFSGLPILFKKVKSKAGNPVASNIFQYIKGVPGEIPQLMHHRNLKIIVPTTHNTLVIMWGRDKNFQVSIMYKLRKRKNKILLGQFLFYSPFN